MSSNIRRLLAGLLISAMAAGVTPAMATEGSDAEQDERTPAVQSDGDTVLTVQETEVSGGRLTFSIQETGYASVTSCKNVRGTLTIPSEIQLKNGNTYPVTEVESSAFSECAHLKKVVFPTSIVEIKPEAFFQCGQLEEVVFNDTSETRVIVTRQGSVWISAEAQTAEETDAVAVQEEDGLVLSGAERTSDGYQLNLKLGETFSVPEHLTDNGEPVDADAIAIRGSNGVITAPRRVLKTWNTGKAKLTIAVGEETLTLHVTVTGNGINMLNEYAFAQCTKLESITIPSTMMEIGVAPFLSCENLKEIVVEDGNRHFAALTSTMLGRVNQKQYEINRAAGMEEAEAKRQAADTLVVLANGVEGDVVIPEGVKELAVGAVYGCNQMMTVTLPSTLVKVNTGGDPSNFSMCDALRSIAVAADNPLYCASDGILYSKDNTSLIKLPEQCGTTVSVPQGVTRIEVYAAEMNGALECLKLPNTLKTIEKYAFYDCEKLKQVTLGGVKTIENSAFAECTALERIRIPRSCTRLGENAFSDAGLTQLHLPLNGSLKTLETGVFSGTNLKTVVIPSSVTKIKERALAGMGQLRALYFMGKRPSIAKSKRGVGGAFAKTPTAQIKLYYRKSQSGWRKKNGKAKKVEDSTQKTWQPPTQPKVKYKRTEKGVTVSVSVNRKQTLTGYEVAYASKKNGAYQKVMTIKASKKQSTVKRRLSSGKRGYYKVRAYCILGGTKVASRFGQPTQVK